MRRKLIDLGTDLINDSYITENDYNSRYLIEKTEQSLFNLTNKNDITTDQEILKILCTNLRYC